jgi:hypothetical protein
MIIPSTKPKIACAEPSIVTSSAAMESAYDTSTNALLIVVTLLSYFGLFSNAIFLRYLQKYPHQGNIFVILVCSANLLSSLVMMVLNTIHLYHNRFSTGYWGCQVYGTNYQFFSSIALIAYLCTPLDSFFIVILRRPKLSENQRLWIAGAVIGVGFLTASVPYWPYSHHHVLANGELFCFGCYTCQEPLSRALALTNIAALVFNPIILFGLFFWIRHRLVHTKSVIPFTVYTQKDAMKSEQSRVQDELQQRIAERGLVLVLVHLITHILTCFRIIHEFLTLTPYDPYVIKAAFILHNLCLSAYPICFYLLEGHGRRWLYSIRSSALQKSENNAPITPLANFAVSEDIAIADTRIF